MLLNKLPEDVCLLISRKVPEKEWSLDAVPKELEDVLQARERVVVDKSPLGSSLAKSERSPPTAATLVAGIGPLFSTPVHHVPLCDDKQDGAALATHVSQQNARTSKPFLT